MRDAGKFQRFTLGKGIANLNGPVIVQTDDVAGVNGAAIPRQGSDIGDARNLAGADMFHFHALFVAP